MRTESVATNPDLEKAKRALEDVNAAIRAYLAEKSRLEKESQLPGVKGLGAKHQLSVLNASPLYEKLQVALIKAESAVRMLMRKTGGTGSVFTKPTGERETKPTDGSLWWVSRSVAAAKERYGR